MTTILGEIVALFVDDGLFAIAILAWIAIAGLLIPRLGLWAPWAGAILFLGLILILIESATRRARR